MLLRCYGDPCGVQVGFSKDGKVLAVDMDLYANCGNSLDLSGAVSMNISQISIDFGL